MESSDMWIKAKYDSDTRLFPFDVKEFVHEEYEILQEIIHNLYDLKKKTFRLTYADNEGDEITIATNHDVRTAVRYFRHGTLRISVRDLVDQEVAPVDNPRTPTYDGEHKVPRQDVHIGVDCDGCDVSPIIGLRYWCTVRPGYNLCQRCHDKHSSHSTLRFRAVPYPWLFEDSQRIVPDPDLKRGESGVEVLFLQKLLFDLGYMAKKKCFCRTGVFGKCTERGLKKFLQDHDIYSSRRGAVYNARAARKLGSVLKEKRYI